MNKNKALIISFLTLSLLILFLFSSCRKWKKKKLYTVEEDEGGYLYVKRHKATWKF